LAEHVFREEAMPEHQLQLKNIYNTCPWNLKIQTIQKSFIQGLLCFTSRSNISATKFILTFLTHFVTSEAPAMPELYSDNVDQPLKLYLYQE